MRRARKSSEETKKEIISAAEDLFSKKGYKESSISEIASHLGMSTASIHKYYKSKKGLAQAICSNQIKQHLDYLEIQLAKIEKAREALMYFSLTNIKAFYLNNYSSTWNYELYFYALEDDKTILYNAQSRMIEMFKNILAKGVTSGELKHNAPDSAEQVYDALQSVMHPVLLRHISQIEASERAHKLITLILNALYIDRT